MTFSPSPVSKIAALVGIGLLAAPLWSSPAIAAPARFAMLEDARALLRVDQTANICRRPLSLSVREATVEEIATRVQKALVAAQIKPSVRVEVRNAQSVGLSFESKNSTVGGVLSSAAALGGAQLWVFTDRLLIAPQEALTKAEEEAIRGGLGFLFSGSRPNRGREDKSLSQALIYRRMAQQKAFATFVSNEVKDLFARSGGGGAGATASAAPTTQQTREEAEDAAPVPTVPLNQLSPESQAMMRELFITMTESDFDDWGDEELVPIHLKLPADTPVEFAKWMNHDTVQISVPDQDGTTWNLSWSPAGMRSFGAQPPSPSTPTPKPNGAGVPPLDPSAGKS